MNPNIAKKHKQEQQQQQSNIAQLQAAGQLARSARSVAHSGGWLGLILEESKKYAQQRGTTNAVLAAVAFLLRKFQHHTLFWQL